MQLFSNKLISKLAFAMARPNTKFSSPDTNLFHDIESDDEHAFGQQHPVKMKFNPDGERFGNELTTNNPVSRVHFKNGTVGYWKPGNGNHADHVREVSAYQLGKKMGIANDMNSEHNALFPAVMRNHRDKSEYGTGEWENGALIKHAPGENYFGGADTWDYSPHANHKNMPELALFDFLTGNHDRHAGNLMVDNANQKVHGIDHGSAFNYNWHYGGQPSGHLDIPTLNAMNDDTPLPPAMLERLRNTPDKDFHDILDRMVQHPDMIHEQMEHERPRGVNSAPRGKREPLWKIKPAFTDMLNVARKSNTFGDLRNNYLAHIYGAK